MKKAENPTKRDRKKTKTFPFFFNIFFLSPCSCTLCVKRRQKNRNSKQKKPAALRLLIFDEYSSAKKAGGSSFRVFEFSSPALVPFIPFVFQTRKDAWSERRVRRCSRLRTLRGITRMLNQQCQQCQQCRSARVFFVTSRLVSNPLKLWSCSVLSAISSET